MPSRVLYVEDHDDTRVLMSILLRGAGLDVTEAASAQEALGLAAAGGFDLYLLDHTFPDASGVTLCKAIRGMHPRAPILFYSARALPQEREAALRAGAQDYLVKPRDLFNVADHVAKWVDVAKKAKAAGARQ